MKKPNKKTIALSVVAFVLILMSLISFTYSWIDDIKLIEFNNDNLADNNAPLKTGVDINSDITITKKNNVIDLGNVLKTGDISFQYNNGTAQAYNEEQATAATAPTQHIKYDTKSGGTVKDPQWNDVGIQKGIDSKKGYFYESGGMHLSPCYSDGENFYFPITNDENEVTGYREGNIDDENVNYISFTAKVSSPDANIDFWFKQLPSITDQTNTSLGQYARYAIIVDGNKHIYSSTGDYKTYDSQSGTVKTYSGNSTAAYTFGNNANNNAQRGQNGNVLFSIKKGDTVNFTVKIWLESGCTATASNIDLQFSTSWGYTRDITIVDQTSSCKYITGSDTNSSWIGSKPLYLVAPGILSEMCKKLYVEPTVDKWDDIRGNAGYEDAPFYDLRDSNVTSTGTTSDGFTYFTISNVPIVYNNEQLMLLRCRKDGDDDDDESPYGWNTGNHHPTGDYSAINCYNWWSTYLPETYTAATYRLYGGSQDDMAERYFKSSVDNKALTYQGYGTWGNLIKITVDGRTKACYWADTIDKVDGDGSLNLAYKGSNNDSIDLYICDYSDYATSQEVYVHGMSYDSRSNVTDSNCWFAYVPESSTLLQFYYDRNNRTNYPRDYGWWGYNSWSGKNPQQRPAGSTKYYFSQRIKHGAASDNYYSAGSDGIGYWDGVEDVYLINNDTNRLSETSFKANMYRNKGYLDFSVSENSMTDTGKTHPSDNRFKIYEISTVNDSNSGYYTYVKFKIGSDYSRSVPMCPGCYFDWAGDRWVGSLTGSGRSDVTPTVDPGGGNSGSATLDGYGIDSGIIFKVDENNTYTVYQKNDRTNSYKVSIPICATAVDQNHADPFTVLKGSDQFGLGNNYSAYSTQRNGGVIYLVKGDQYNFGFYLGSGDTAGDYIVTLKYQEGNSNTIEITDVEKAAS